MSPPDRIRPQIERASRRIVASLFFDRSLVSAGTIAMATVMSIVATELTGNPSWAGVPAAIYQLSAAGAAFVWGVLWDRTGRRLGLSLAMAVGCLGALVGAASVEIGSIGVLLAGVVAVGATQSGATLSRFIAAEVSPPQSRGRAISLVVWGGTIGAVGGPLLVGPSSRLAAGLGLNELTGPIALAAPLLAVAAALTYAGLRPEPMEISRRLDADDPARSMGSVEARPLSRLLRLPGVIVAVSAVLLAQTVMVMLMVITSLYMRGLGHSLGDISLVFSAHTLGMFAFSPISGRLSDRVGRGPVLIAGGLITILSALIAPISPQVPGIAAGLFLLGLGWNFSFVAGSALLSDMLTPPERSRTQGANDLLIGLASGLGSLSSGVVFAALGYRMVSLFGAILMALAVALSTWWLLGRRRVGAVSAG